MPARLNLSWYLAALCAAAAANPVHVARMQALVENRGDDGGGGGGGIFGGSWLMGSVRGMFGGGGGGGGGRVQNYLLYAVGSGGGGNKVQLGAFGAWHDLPDATGRFFAPADPRGVGVDPVVALLTVQACLFLAWLVDPAAPLLRRHCTVSPSNLSAGRIWCLVLGPLSHADGFHFFINAVMFSSASSIVYPSLCSRGEFCALVLSAAAVSGVASVVCNRLVLGRHVELLGWSGATFAVQAWIAMEQPDMRFQFALVGRGGRGVSALEMLGINLAVDFFLRRGVDLFCHAGGAAWGLLWATSCADRAGVGGTGWLAKRSAMCLRGGIVDHAWLNGVLLRAGGIDLQIDRQTGVLLQVSVALALACTVWCGWLERRHHDY